MMNLFQGASDDQVALMGCFVALVGSVFLMYVSFYVGPASRKNAEGAKTGTGPIPSHPIIDLPVESTRGRAA